MKLGAPPELQRRPNMHSGDQRVPATNTKSLNQQHPAYPAPHQSDVIWANKSPYCQLLTQII